MSDSSRGVHASATRILFRSLFLLVRFRNEWLSTVKGEKEKRETLSLAERCSEVILFIENIRDTFFALH